MTAAYSHLKAAWHTDKIEAMRRGEQVVPAQVQLILSDLCNQDCHFCAYRMSGGFSSEQFGEGDNRNPNRKIPTAKSLEIVKDCVILGVKAIQFTGGGEPTVHTDHLEIFSAAQSLGLETSLVTNGVIFKPGWENVLPKMKWVRVSIDASTPAEYAAVRRTRPESFTKALAHVADLRHEIDKQGSDCYLGCGFVVTMENYKGIRQAVRLIKDAGAHNVRLSAMFSDKGADYYSLEAAAEIGIATAEARMEHDGPGFKVIDLFGDRINDLVQHAPDYSFCGYQQMNLYIGGNQKVYRCCTTAYTKHGEVGDLTNRRFAEWFHSVEKKMAYKNFDARSCHDCQFNGQNRVINYLTGPEPQHVNFV